MVSFKNSRGGVELIILLLVIAFGAIIAGGLTAPKGFLSPNSGTTGTTDGAYTCCDTGDGDQCKLQDKKFTWKGTNATDEEYALIKSNIKLLEQSGHLAPMGTSSTGEKIYVNTSDTTASYGSIPGCERGKDLVFGKSGCVGIPNDEIIYACKEGCDSSSIGKGSFDAYFRVKDGAIPDVVKNCDKGGATSGGGGQVVVTEIPQNGKQNLQLKTFKIIQSQTNTKWLSPYCKPAIYLYPEKETGVNVKVAPLGKMTYTIPPYPDNGWKVTAKPSGEIVSNGNSYDYLYYEAQIPDENIEKPKDGFVVNKADIGKLLGQTLPNLGLNEKESKEFLDYWVKVLPNSPYYFIGIVSQSNLNTIAPLSIQPKPKTVIRVTLYFEALDKKIPVQAPTLSQVKREGFTVVEWGGLFKRDAKHPFTCFN